MSIRIGYKVAAEQFGPRELVELTVAAEGHGFDSALASDHFSPWRHDGGHAPSSLMWLAAAAERTTDITLGTSVLTPTFRYNPAVVAQTFATLACLCPDRIVLGVGTGEALNEITTGWRGDWPPFKERFARLREAVDVIRALWTGECVDHDGEYYRTVGATLYDIPERAPRLFVAAGGPLVARYAGRVGDGFVCTSGKGHELYADRLLPAVREGQEKAGRSGIEKMIELKLSYDRDPQQALENTRFWAPLSLSAEQKHSISDPREMERAADALPIEQIASRWIVASTPDAVVEAVREYTDLGFDHLVVHAPGHDQRRFMAQFEADLLDPLRALSPR